MLSQLPTRRCVMDEGSVDDLALGWGGAAAWVGEGAQRSYVSTRMAVSCRAYTQGARGPPSFPPAPACAPRAPADVPEGRGQGCPARGRMDGCWHSRVGSLGHMPREACRSSTALLPVS